MERTQIKITVAGRNYRVYADGDQTMMDQASNEIQEAIELNERVMKIDELRATKVAAVRAQYFRLENELLAIEYSEERDLAVSERKTLQEKHLKMLEESAPLFEKVERVEVECEKLTQKNNQCEKDVLLEKE